MVVQIGNAYYVIFIELAVLFLLLLVAALQGKSRDFAHAVLLVLLFCNLALHFLKQAFPPYIDHFPQSIRRSTFENLCAVSTVLFPFCYLFRKQNVLHDFVFFMGMCGGIGALLYPTETIGMSPLAFDTIRFYTCHTILLVVPLAAAILGVYRPRLSRFWAIPLLFLVWETVICLNEFHLIGVGLVDGEFSDLLNAGFRNSSFAFGVRPDFAWAAKVFDPLVPTFFRTDAFGLNGGTPFYFPVLWLIGPAFVFLIPIYAIFTAPFAIYTALRRPSRPAFSAFSRDSSFSASS